MDKATFNQLKVGDKVEYAGIIHEIAEVERFMVSPGYSETYAITTLNGSRMKEIDPEVKELHLIKKQGA